MTIKRAAGGTQATVSFVRRSAGGSYVNVSFVRRLAGGAWVTVWPTSTPLAASASPSRASGAATSTTASFNVTSNSVTVNTSGGSGAAKTYAWAFLSGSSMNIGSPSAASTNFSSFISGDTTRNGVFRCTVSDGTYTSTVDVPVSLTYTKDTGNPPV